MTKSDPNFSSAHGCRLFLDTMDPSLLFRELEDIVEQIGISVRYENFVESDTDPKSGLCIIRGKPFLLIEKSAGLQKKIKVFVHCLLRFDLQDIFIKPAVRNYLMDFKKVTKWESEEPEENYETPPF